MAEKTSMREGADFVEKKKQSMKKYEKRENRDVLKHIRQMKADQYIK